MELMRKDERRLEPTSILGFPTCTRKPLRNSRTVKSITSSKTGFNSPVCLRWRFPTATLLRSWKIVSYVRSLRCLTGGEKTMEASTFTSARYVGSQACQKCHKDIYDCWKETPMANVVRDPRERPDAIIPDLSTNTIARFTEDRIAFVYGRKWKQRCFTKIGDDHFRLNGTSAIKHGGPTTYQTLEQIGGLRNTHPTTCSVRPERPATAATPSVMTFTPNRSASGT
jgi:hypothetical protein